MPPKGGVCFYLLDLMKTLQISAESTANTQGSAWDIGLEILKDTRQGRRSISWAGSKRNRLSRL